MQLSEADDNASELGQQVLQLIEDDLIKLGIPQRKISAKINKNGDPMIVINKSGILFSWIDYMKALGFNKTKKPYSSLSGAFYDLAGAGAVITGGTLTIYLNSYINTFNIDALKSAITSRKEYDISGKSASGVEPIPFSIGWYTRDLNIYDLEHNLYLLNDNDSTIDYVKVLNDLPTNFSKKYFNTVWINKYANEHNLTSSQVLDGLMSYYKMNRAKIADSFSRMVYNMESYKYSGEAFYSEMLSEVIDKFANISNSSYSKDLERQAKNKLKDELKSDFNSNKEAYEFARNSKINIDIVDAKYPKDDAKHPRTSSVVSSSFTEYYYYNVTATVGDRTYTYELVDGHYYSGGWN